VRRYWPIVPLAAALVAHSLVFDFVSDDAFISFVYSRNLAEHGELVFNLGDRVEGFTNFLWTVLLGGLMTVGIPPEISSRVLGTGFGVATLFAVMRITLGLGLRRGWGAVAAGLLAAASGYACWCSGGLETQLFTFLVTLAIAAYLEERPVATGLVLALATLTRPEGALVAAVLGLHRRGLVLVTRRRLLPDGFELAMAGAFLALFVPYWAWRWSYYGWPFPNTFYVKAGGEPSAEYSRKLLSRGLFYVWQWAWQSRAVFAVPLVLAAFWKHARFASLALLFAGVYLGYTVSVGGDFMGLHRFVMPLFVVVALTAVLGLAHLTAPLSPRTTALAAVLLVAGFAASEIPVTRAALVPRADNGIDRPGYLAVYAHDRGLLGKALAPHIRPDDFSVFGGAGVQPYYGRLRGVDVFGLVSEEVAHEEPPTNPRPGHQKWARPERVLAWSPTFLFYCYDLHREPSKYRLCGESGFFLANGYEPVTLFVPGLRERGEYYTFLKRKDRAWP
jgi:arabinofuranosyltransferase